MPQKPNYKHLIKNEKGDGVLEVLSIDEKIFQEKCEEIMNIVKTTDSPLPSLMAVLQNVHFESEGLFLVCISYLAGRVREESMKATAVEKLLTIERDVKLQRAIKNNPIHH